MSPVYTCTFILPQVKIKLSERAAQICMSFTDMQAMTITSVKIPHSKRKVMALWRQR